MSYLRLYIAGLLLLAACRAPDKTALPDQFYTQLTGRLASWHKWLSRDSSFNAEWGEYVRTEKTISFHPVRTPTSIDSLHDFGLYTPFFLYNEDSSLAINLFPNLVLKEQQGKAYCIGSWEPEESFDLINLKTRTSEQIYSAGTPTSFHDGTWLTKTKAAIAGIDRSYTDERYSRPFIMIVDFADSTVTHYSALDSIIPQGSYIREHTLRNVDFESKRWEDFPDQR